jgi:hypothetical protein
MLAGNTAFKAHPRHPNRLRFTLEFRLFLPSGHVLQEELCVHEWIDVCAAEEEERQIHRVTSIAPAKRSRQAGCAEVLLL